MPLVLFLGLCRFYAHWRLFGAPEPDENLAFFKGRGDRCRHILTGLLSEVTQRGRCISSHTNDNVHDGKDLPGYMSNMSGNEQCTEQILCPLQYGRIRFRREQVMRLIEDQPVGMAQACL